MSVQLLCVGHVVEQVVCLAEDVCGEEIFSWRAACRHGRCTRIAWIQPREDTIVATERTASKQQARPPKKEADRDRKKDSDRTDVRERGPDTGGGKLRPSDRPRSN